MADPKNTARSHLTAAIPAALALAGLWVLFAGVDATAWVIGVPTVAAAAWCHAALAGRDERATLALPLLALAPRFIAGSLAGGTDVALRALRPASRLNPHHHRHTVALPDGAGRLLYINLVSLLPGTLSTRDLGDRLDVHALDTGFDDAGALADLERHVARVYGVEPRP